MSNSKCASCGAPLFSGLEHFCAGTRAEEREIIRVLVELTVRMALELSDLRTTVSGSGANELRAESADIWSKAVALRRRVTKFPGSNSNF